jgi:hypothetical protein
MSDPLEPQANLTHICIDCVAAHDNNDPVAPNEHGLCPRCGSSSVVPLDTLSELVKRVKSLDRPLATPTDQTRARHEAMKAQRKADAAPLINWLRSLNHTQSLEDAITEWDGWAYHVDYPWDPEFTCFTITLISSNRNARCWEITLSAELNTVRSFQFGTI